MRFFLSVDGGGTKTDFLLIDQSGQVLATRSAGSAYYLEIGMTGLRSMLTEAIRDMLASQGLKTADIAFAFLGLPAYGENSKLLPQLDAILDEVLPKERYHCANDVVCGWAGALAHGDGIAVVAGTGSIAYGEYDGRNARAGGWGELFSDEASAFWLAREALTMFSRMSDGRAERGILYELIRQHFGVSEDLDVCAAVYGPPALSRSELAALAPLVTQSARAGDGAALRIFSLAGEELALLMHAVRDALRAPPEVLMPASYCGGLLHAEGLLLPLFERALHATERRYQLKAPLLPPSAGAAVAAARLAGWPLDPAAIERLAQSHAAGGLH